MKERRREKKTMFGSSSVMVKCWHTKQYQNFVAVFQYHHKRRSIEEDRHEMNDVFVDSKIFALRTYVEDLFRDYPKILVCLNNFRIGLILKRKKRRRNHSILHQIRSIRKSKRGSDVECCSLLLFGSDDRAVRIFWQCLTKCFDWSINFARVFSIVDGQSIVTMVGIGEFDFDGDLARGGLCAAWRVLFGRIVFESI